MKAQTSKSWVVVKFRAIGNESGAVKIWRDYGQAWGSPSYTVLGYFDGPHAEALKDAARLKLAAYRASYATFLTKEEAEKEDR